MCAPERRLCFSKDGLLQNEFKNLYHSLFDDATHHLAVIKALAKNNAGMTRNEIIEAADLSSGGRITELLEELIESGFITAWLPYDKKSKETIYKLSVSIPIFTSSLWKIVARKEAAPG